VTLAVNIEHIAQAGLYCSYVHRTDNGYGKATADWVPTGWDSPGREITVTHDLRLLKDIIDRAAGYSSDDFLASCRRPLRVRAR
jgi:hypothetical protein